MEDPWVVASQIFAPCYIGGWSAAEHWDFTEQIYNSIAVMTTKQQRKKEQVIKNTRFVLRTLSKERFFGTKGVWKGSIKVEVSDPTKTIVDMLDDPAVGGGVRPVTDMLLSYFESEHLNEEKLLEYSLRMKNGAIFKRLGFILEQNIPEKRKLLESCKKSLSKGTAKIDPNLKCSRLVTRWKLWVPEGFEQ
jgi:predicted transcriptional regulator of viral defense system